MRVVVVALVLASTLAHAQGVPPSEADRLFDEGRELAKAMRFVEACERFKQSLQLEYTIGTELNLADCEERLGHLRIAFRMFTSAAAAADRAGDRKRAQFARERAAAVQAQLATLVVKIANPDRAGLVVTIAGEAVPPAAEIREVYEPGIVEVVATAPGMPRFASSARLRSGATVTVEVTDPTQRQPDSGRRARMWWVLGLGIGAGAGAITAGVLTWKGRRDYREAAATIHCFDGPQGLVCDDIGRADIRRAQRYADLGTGFAIGAGVLLGTAAVLYVTAPREQTIAPIVTSDRVGISFTRRF